MCSLRGMSWERFQGEISGEVSGGGFRGRFQGELSGGGFRGSFQGEVSGGRFQGEDWGRFQGEDWEEVSGRGQRRRSKEEIFLINTVFLFIFQPMISF